MNQSHRLPIRFYFALPRLLAMLRGGDPRRGEQNGTEASVAGIASYLVSYLFFAGFLPETFAWWTSGLLLVILAFLVCPFWVLALHLNSLVLKLVGWSGLFRAVPVRHCQSVLVATTTTAMAIALVQRGGLAGELGAIWVAAVAINLGAALILAFRNRETSRA